jgi:hypothetical protein
MKSRIIAVSVSISLLAFACLLLPLSAASAQSACGIGQVQPLNAFVNVRGQAGNTTATPIATVVRGTNAPVSNSVVVRTNEVWYGLCQGGYVSGAVVRYSTNTPTRTPTRTPTVAPRTATASPTRQPTSTQGPTPTDTPTPSVSRITVYEMSDGSIRLDGYCVEACEWSFDMRDLPE